MKPWIPTLLLLAASAHARDDLPAWGPRQARHLLNRAAFGGDAAQVERWAALGPRAAVERLFAEPEREPFAARRLRLEEDPGTLRRRGVEELRAARAELRQRHRQQRDAYLAHWVERMLVEEAPLRERMTLFWHGVLTTQASKVRDSYLLVRQSQLLREHALGNYGELLRAILRDPAMLEYLDNDTNRRGHPNENLARELLELFGLGEGHYTEADVTEVARALTGYGVDREGRFVRSRREHDGGIKHVLGVPGEHDADSVVDVILAQPACGRWIAGRLLEYLEGLPPEPARLREYGRFLRERNYELEPFLRRLFLDPEFYRPEVVAARVQSPLDHLVGASRRLGLAPAPTALAEGAAMLGEELLEPPSVRGWEGGLAWIDTSSFMARGNMAGALLGVVGLEELRSALAESERAMDEALEEVMEDAGGERMSRMSDATMRSLRRRDRLTHFLRRLDGAGPRSELDLTGRLRAADLRGDRGVVDHLCNGLLAIEAPLETRRMLTVHLREERRSLGLRPGELRGEEAEALLRRLAHLILSLPEAQLH